MKINDLSARIAKDLRLYTDEVEEQLKVTIEEVAVEAVESLKANSPRDTGDYAKSWRMRKTKTGIVIHNKDHYQLTHLLERGHAKVGGGRVAAQPHIKPVEQEAIRSIDRKVRRLLKR